MPVSVTLPALGESVTEGTVTRWLKQPGDTVAADEPLLEVSTDKVDTEIPSPAGGVLLEIKVAEDETVDVGTELAVIGDESESAETSSAAPATAAPDAAPEAQPEQAAEPEPAAQPEPAAEPEPPAQQEPPGEAATAGEPEQAATASGGEGGQDTTSVTLPALGESVTEGTVTRWLKQVGDQVAADEPLLEVSTDKVDTEIPSPAAGELLEIKVAEDETVEVGAELAVIGTAAGAGPAPAQPQQPAQPEPDAQRPKPAQQPVGDEELHGSDEFSGDEEPSSDEQPATAPQQPAASVPAPTPAPAVSASPPAARPEPPKATPPSNERQPASSENSAYVTPLVRKLANQHGVELSQLRGTGVGGRIRKQDVLAAADNRQATSQPSREPQPEPAGESAQAAPAPAAASAPAASQPSPLRGTTEKMSRLRKVIAARMVESLQTSAQLTTVMEVDVTDVGRLRDKVKGAFEQREGVKLSYLPFFAKATIDALKAFPNVNATIDTDKGEITYFDREHLGIAVDTERGLLVPVIKDAGDLSIPGLARKIADLAERTRGNKITPDELSGGTFTLTNTGSRGALFDTPIINQPQVGILGTGSVVKRAVVIDDPNLGETIAVRQMVYLALTYDHRLVDGADAARFLAAVKHRLEEADFEAELGVT